MDRPEKRDDGMQPVVRLPRADLPRVTDVLADAFRGYPVLRHVLGGDDPRHDAAHRRLVGFFLMARFLRDEPVLGIEIGGDLAAAALVSFPDGPESPPELATLRENVWAEVGAAARARYEACGAAWAPLSVDVPHIHLNMIGVRRAFQGRRLGRRLLDHVHQLSRGVTGSQGVTLTTEDPANVPLYEHVGYEVVGRARIAPELETWSMFRRNGP